MDSYLEFVLERLSIIGNVSSRPMFGGYGIYLGESMFGLVAEGALYLKVGESNIKDYIQADMKPFTYEAKNGKPISMSYWGLPVDILETNEDLLKWAEKSIEIAKAVKSRKKILKKVRSVTSKKKSATAKKKSTAISKKKLPTAKKKVAPKLAKKKPIVKKKR